ncbi:MAG: trehalose-phosphatase [Terriglobia bacterium]
MRTPSTLWAELARRLPHADLVAVLSDFDGTLSPLIPYPRRARLPALTRRALRRLARCPRVQVAIVSGRRLEELRRLVSVPDIWYVGSHGLEFCPPRGRRIVYASVAERRQMRAFARRLKHRLRRLAGIWVEPKPASVTVHFRRATSVATRQARAIVTPEWRRENPPVRFQQAKKVWEFLPTRDVSKATAAAWLLARWSRPRRGWRAARPGRRLALSLGDDQADERVFRRLGPAAISIHVGRGPTRARYRLRSPEAAGRLLARLGEALGCA